MNRSWMLIALTVVLALPLTAEPQALYATPDDAVKGLMAAAEAKDQSAMMAVFGPDRERMLTGDPVEDRNSLDRFSVRLHQGGQLQKVDDNKFTLLVGEDKWPFPIPIVKEGNQWRFDTAAGLQEILNRRIGRNELSAIMTCRAYVVAQWEYFTQPLDTSEAGLAVYAQRFMSTPGKHDGLYWDTPEGAPASPFGEYITSLRAEGYTPGQRKSAEPPKEGAAPAQRQRTPYHGYYFRILKRQGTHAPGGAFSYVINGHMIAGYGLVAYPSKWGSSGVMTFIVNQQGRIYEKNLGANTGAIAAAITEYDPDPTWKLVTEE